MNSGYLYVLVHPSDPILHKIGVTIHPPEKRLAQHNRQFDKYAGQIVKETGQEWVLKTYVPVDDPYWAERCFWAVTPFPLIPYGGGIEVQRMEWDLVQKGLTAALAAGVRPKPGTLPDYVYAYTATIRRRLEGRNITLQGYVRSLTGKANFRCCNGHSWRATPIHVGEGQGCPKCGVGEQASEEIRQRIGAGVICLLTQSESPGLVRIETGYGTLEEVTRLSSWGNWDVHRFRNVEEVELAESLIWNLLDRPLPNDRDPIEIDLNEAEDAFRKLIYAMREEIALVEKALEVSQSRQLHDEVASNKA